jgi:hypothetical protein
MDLLRLSVVIFFLGMFSVFGSSSTSIFIEKPIMDFGTLTVSQVSKNKNLEAVFKIQNRGNQTLKIEKIATSCGCTSAKPDKTEVQSGDILYLNVDINLSGKSGKKKVQIIVSFSNGDLASLEVAYDVQIDAALFPLQLSIQKKSGESAQETLTAYFSFSSPITEEKLPKIEVLSKHPAITIRKKGVRIGKTPNELNGHYYCSVDFEASISPEVQELISFCVLTQDEDPVCSIPIIITEKKDLWLRRSSFTLGTVKQGEIIPINLEIEGHAATEKPSLTIEGLVDGSLKTEQKQNRLILSFDLRWDKAGFSCSQGTVVMGVGNNLPFSCIANVVVK